METEDKNETSETRKEKEQKARAEMWVIQQQIKSCGKFAEENGGS